MSKQEYIEAFMDCVKEVIVLGFNLEKNSSVQLIASTFELMRWSGTVDEFICDECLFDIIFGDAEPSASDISPIPS